MKIRNFATQPTLPLHTMRHLLHLLTLLAVLTGMLTTACRPSGSAQTDDKQTDTAFFFRHARLIKLHVCNGYEKVVVQNPWDTTRILHTYLLIPDSAAIPSNLPEGTVIRTPLRRVVALSGVHAGLIRQFGALDRLCGLCDANYVTDSVLRERMWQGNILDMGSSMSPNTELLLSNHPDAIWVSPFENSGGYGLLDRIGVPLIECADYMENSPLGRAEWMRFYGRLMGCAERADSLFHAVEQHYTNLKRQVAQTSTRPLLMTDLKNGTSWYVPGGNSTLGRLYADAGANYAFAGEKQSGSVALSFEAVYQAARKADVWLIKYGQEQDLTYSQIKQDFAPYTDFRPWKERRIYGCNTLHIPFYEEEPFRPDLLLEDLISVFHPELVDSLYTPRYFTPLNDD